MAKFLTIQGWDVSSAHSMLAQAGTRESSGSNFDSDAYSSDPLWDRDVPGTTSPFNHTYESTAELLGLAMAGILSIASEVRNGDVVVLFGRDLYPIQAILTEWKPFLRGTWVYVEGVSRAVLASHRSKGMVSKIQAMACKYRRKGGQVFGVDTGFAGSVPRMALKGMEYKLRLLSGDAACKEVLSRTSGWATLIPGRRTGYTRRTQVLKLEHLPKPFLRCVEIDGATSLPVLRLACRQDIINSMMIMIEAQELAIRHMGQAKRCLKEGAASKNRVRAGDRFLKLAKV